MIFGSEVVTRRSALRALAGASIGKFLPHGSDSPPKASPSVGSDPQHEVAVDNNLTLAPWTPGTLDLHHISTGRGNVTYIVCPDGTTLLVDAGALNSAPGWSSDEKYRIAPKPNSSRRPGEWIARYIQRHMPPGRSPGIDCFLLTHFHADHMGAIDLLPHTPVFSKFGQYELTGVMDVHEAVPIHRIVDRAWPDYNYPVPLEDPHQQNYRSFLKDFVRNGGTVERFIPGVDNQIKLVTALAGEYRNCTVRNLAANGRVWTGAGDGATETFPRLSSLKKEDYPSENKCSLALLLSYGAFRYFSAGDMGHETAYGRLPWGDIESRVASVAGPVDVAIANHHGYANACGPDWVRSLQAKAYVISAWDSAHPTIPSMDNMLSKELYTSARDVYSTALKAENVIATKRLRELQSQNGHIVVRVAPTGGSFHIFVTTNADESDAVLAMRGPYGSGFGSSDGHH